MRGDFKPAPKGAFWDFKGGSYWWLGNYIQ